MRGLFICLVIVLLLGSCVPLKDDISINPLTIIKHFTKKKMTAIYGFGMLLMSIIAIAIILAIGYFVINIVINK